MVSDVKDLQIPTDRQGLSPETVEKLFIQASIARERSYCPYSNFAVGAAILTADGSIVLGCNVENGSYGATVCAERTAIVTAVCQGYTEFEAFGIIADYYKPIPPCGLCRQVVSEFSGRKVIVMFNTKGECQITSFSTMHPFPFEFS